MFPPDLQNPPEGAAILILTEASLGRWRKSAGVIVGVRIWKRLTEQWDHHGQGTALTRWRRVLSRRSRV